MASFSIVSKGVNSPRNSCTQMNGKISNYLKIVPFFFLSMCKQIETIEIFLFRKWFPLRRFTHFEAKRKIKLKIETPDKLKMEFHKFISWSSVHIKRQFCFRCRCRYVVWYEISEFDIYLKVRKIEIGWLLVGSFTLHKVQKINFLSESWPICWLLS